MFLEVEKHSVPCMRGTTGNESNSCGGWKHQMLNRSMCFVFRIRILAMNTEFVVCLPVVANILATRC